jgi:proteic killer suppression protein
VDLEFEDDDLRRLYVEPGFRLPSLGPDITSSFRRKVQLLAAAVDDRDIRAMRSLRMEKLVGDRAGQYSVRLNDQFRLIFRLMTGGKGRVVIIVEVVDYH